MRNRNDHRHHDHFMRNRNDHHNHDHFGRRKFLLILLVPLFLAAAGGAVMFLWNAIFPALFGIKLITFWQSVGLLILCRLLFGHFGGGHHHHDQHGRHRGWPNSRRQGWGRRHSAIREKLVRMNEEERRLFLEEWKKRMRP